MPDGRGDLRPVPWDSDTATCDCGGGYDQATTGDHACSTVPVSVDDLGPLVSTLRYGAGRGTLLPEMEL